MTTHKFKKGQLVAVRDSDRQDWKLRVYDCEENGRHYCIAAEHECDGMPIYWAQVAPAEIIWPNLTLSVDLLLREELVKQSYRHERQVQWLCEQLQGINVKTWKNDLTGPPNCPSDEFSCDGQDKCAECWRRAAEQAVAEEFSPKG